ncbi:hypothetical protein C1646_811522 [Rhizophagus diaphanus]|nr:hypothetical protein C1646_811522 [Rhizophagus diaphanus] [Rhizophagus sp. MUCL 43196]
MAGYNTLSDHSELATKAEGHEVLNDYSELSTKGNDMELFHFLSAGPLVINARAHEGYPPKDDYENSRQLYVRCPPTNWIIPDVDSVVARLRQLLDLGFQLTGSVMEKAFHFI